MEDLTYSLACDYSALFIRSSCFPRSRLIPSKLKIFRNTFPLLFIKRAGVVTMASPTTVLTLEKDLRTFIKHRIIDTYLIGSLVNVGIWGRFLLKRLRTYVYGLKS